jgi:hypothetical protein
MRGPARNAVLVQAVHDPIAFAWAGPENVERMSASELGTRSAPAMPWRARAAMSTPAVGATAQISDVTPNPTRPQNSTFLRPKASEREPASRMMEPSVMR